MGISLRTPARWQHSCHRLRSLELPQGATCFNLRQNRSWTIVVQTRHTSAPNNQTNGSIVTNASTMLSRVATQESNMPDGACVADGAGIDATTAGGVI